MGQYQFWYNHEGTRYVVDVDAIALGWAIADVHRESTRGSASGGSKLIADWDGNQGWCRDDCPSDAFYDCDEIRAFARAIRADFGGRLSATLELLADAAEAVNARIGALND